MTYGTEHISNLSAIVRRVNSSFVPSSGHPVNAGVSNLVEQNMKDDRKKDAQNVQRCTLYPTPPPFQGLVRYSPKCSPTSKSAVEKLHRLLDSKAVK